MQVVTMTGKPMGDGRKWTVLSIGAKTTVGLRSGAAQQGIRQMADFINALILAGVMMGKSVESEEAGASFLEIFEEEADEIAELILLGQFSADVAAVGSHDIGEAIEVSSDIVIAGALSASNVIDEISADYDLSPREKLVIVTEALMLAAVGGSTPETHDIAIDMVKEAVRAKAEVWNQSIPDDSEWVNE